MSIGYADSKATQPRINWAALDETVTFLD
jgi:hypothetical protein